MLDTAGIGTHLIVGSAPSLGLSLGGKYTLTEALWKQVGTTREALDNGKAMVKIQDRMRLFHHPANSVISKAIAFSMYIFFLLFSFILLATMDSLHELLIDCRASLKISL